MQPGGGAAQGVRGEPPPALTLTRDPDPSPNPSPGPGPRPNLPTPWHSCFCSSVSSLRAARFGRSPRCCGLSALIDAAARKRHRGRKACDTSTSSIFITKNYLPFTRRTPRAEALLPRQHRSPRGRSRRRPQSLQRQQYRNRHELSVWCRLTGCR